MVWSIIASEAFPGLDSDNKEHANPLSRASTPTERVHVTGGGLDPRRATHDLRTALQPPPDEETVMFVLSIITDTLQLHSHNVPSDAITMFVQSIMASDSHPFCPKFWHHAMKDPVTRGKWIEAMYKHLDSC